MLYVDDPEMFLFVIQISVNDGSIITHYPTAIWENIFDLFPPHPNLISCSVLMGVDFLKCRGQLMLLNIHPLKHYRLLLWSEKHECFTITSVFSTYIYLHLGKTNTTVVGQIPSSIPKSMYWSIMPDKRLNSVS